MIRRRKSRKTQVGKTGRIRLGPQDMSNLRWRVFARANGDCELRLSPRCWGTAGWDYGHLAHIQSKGACGSDVESNVRWSCMECHSWQHNGGKPCPPKVTQ